MNNEEVRKLVIEYDQGNAEKKEEIELLMVSRLIDEVSFSSEEAIFLTLIWKNEIKKEQKKYDIITKSVYSIGEKQIDSELIDANLEKLEEAINKGEFLNQESAEKYCKKLVKHIDLAKIQKDYIQENLIQLEKDISIANKKVKDISDIKSSMYTEFVTILGIFATIIFAVFGGFQEIQALGSNLKQVDITKILFFLPLLMLGINFILFLSFNSISKIIGKPIKSCGHENPCDCSFDKKHPTIFYSSKIFIWFFLIGAALMLFNSQFNWTFKNVSSKINFAILIVIIVVPIIFTSYKYNKLKKSKNVEKKSNDCKEIKNSSQKSKFINFSNYYLRITICLILLSFVLLFIWSLRQMKGEHDLGLEKLLNHKVFLKLSIFSTLITFFFGSVLPAFYGLWTNPNDSKNKYAPKIEYEINHRSNVQDTLIFTTFLLFFSLLITFIITFINTDFSLKLGLIFIIIIFIFLIIYSFIFFKRKKN
ncbi:hypothetical protein [Staphylococcus hominis]